MGSKIIINFSVCERVIINEFLVCWMDWKNIAYNKVMFKKI